MQAARCAWEVTAGLIPGQPMSEYTRRWAMTSAEWELPQNVALYNAALVGAMEYARYLMNPGSLNWVRVDWIWF
jgi:hypothetical protein